MTQQPKPPFPEQQHEKPGIESEIEPQPKYLAPDYKGADKLDGKVALITGGDSGIGRAVAVLYAREGANVGIVYLPEEQSDAETTKKAVEDEGGECLLIACDVQDAENCEDAVSQVIDKYGQLDILVNNAAYQNTVKEVEALSLEQWDTTFKTNIYGYFYMVKAALPHLKEGSVIINTGSITGLEGSDGLLDYSATKGAIHAFTKTLARQLVTRKIRVNCVAPGPVWTPLNPSDKSPEAVSEFGMEQPMERPAQPEEVAPSYVFFASNADSSYITGEVLTLLGGETRAG